MRGIGVSSMMLALATVACGHSAPESTFVVESPEASESAKAVVELLGAGVISTGRNETFPVEDPSDASLWFSVYDTSFGDQTVMVARRTADGWTAPEVAPFSGIWGDRAPRFSADGATLYFSSNRPRDPGGEAGDVNLWRVERSDEGWSEPQLLDGAATSEANDMHSSATEDALWLASNREGSLGRSDIFRVAVDGGIEQLGSPIHDEYSQPDLWVASDESWMIVVITDHPDGFGGDDLYLSRFDGTSWSRPGNLGPEINSEEYEYGPTLSADGEWLYFTSHRDGTADIYRVPVAALG